jgi:ectoine hydroxylase-related dioxygenase (phytanoyl-CoA dioxygenase family)
LDQYNVLSSLQYQVDDDWIDENNEPGCAAVGELHVQGLVNLADNLEEDGGFWLVPGFHKYMAQWAIEQSSLRKRFGSRSRFLLFDERYIPDMYAAARHISARAGSAILWDQRTMHGSRANCSLRPRFAQFFKMFPREHPAMTEERAEYRREAILRKLRKANINPKTDLTSLGRNLFGLIESLE